MMFLAIPGPEAWEEADASWAWSSAGSSTDEPQTEAPKTENLKTEEPKMKLSREYNDDTPRAGHILLTFPDELLSNILEFAVIPPPEIGWDGKPQWPYRTQYDGVLMRNVALTCRRFSQIMVPFIYRRKQALYNMRLIPPEPRLELLLRTFRENPSLGLYCRELYTNVREQKSEDEPDEDCELAEQLPAFVPNVKHMFVRGGFTKDRAKQTWKFMRACAQHMHQLEHLNIAQLVKGSFSVAEFIQVFQGRASALEYLTVIGFSASESRCEDLEIHKAPKLKTIDLSSFSDTAEGLSMLLSWPEALSTFRIMGGKDEKHNPIDLPMVKEMLVQHKDSLVELKIEHLPDESKGKPFDFSEFSALETLSLSRWHFASSKEKLPDSKQVYAGCLSPPRLKKFNWSFDMMDSLWPQWDDFGEEEESWIRKLAQTVIASGSSLQEIQIKFGPVGPEDEVMDSEYPWDRMDALNEEFQSRGIAITYTKPSLDRQSWAQDRAWKRGAGRYPGRYAYPF